jgi:uncharacterized protein involved in type VI secretion and phage assembly
MIPHDLLKELVTPQNDTRHFYGVTVGVVTNNQDPDALGRVKVSLPWLSEQDESNWARVAAPMAGNDRGAFFLPEVDDEVLVAFEHGMVEFPYVIGALWNGKDTPPESNDDGENNARTIKSRSGHFIRLFDKDGEEKIEIIDKSGKNSVVVSSSNDTITITADSDLTIQSNNGKLMLSGNGVEITSQAEVKVKAGADMNLESGSQMNVKGATVNIN